MQLLYLVSRGSAPLPPPITSTFAFVAKPCPPSSSQPYVELGKYRGLEKAQNAKWSRAQLDALDPLIMLAIDRYYIIDEDKEESILFQACSAAGFRANAKLSSSERSDRVRRANAKQTAEEKTARGIKSTANLSADALRDRAMRGAQSRTAEARSESSVRGHASMTVEARSKRKTDGLEHMGEQGLQVMGAKVRKTTTGGREVRLGEWADVDKVFMDQWQAQVRQYRDDKEKEDGERPTNQYAKHRIISSMKYEILGPNGPDANHGNESYYQYWPEALPYDHKKFTADELDGFGAAVLAGLVKACTKADVSH